MEEDCLKETPKKEKNWGTGGGLYRGVKASVKTLNYIIIVLIIALIGVVMYLSSTSSYTIYFEVNGGEALTQGQYKYGDTVEVGSPVKTGYLFDGWYQDQDLTKVWDEQSDIIKGSMVLYAKWVPANIHVLFDLNGGLVEGQQTLPARDIAFHTEYGTLPTPVKEGYRFVGWQYNGAFITDTSVVTMNGEHTLKAIFE